MSCHLTNTQTARSCRSMYHRVMLDNQDVSCDFVDVASQREAEDEDHMKVLGSEREQGYGVVY